MVKLSSCAFRVLASHVLSDYDAIDVLLYGHFLFSFCFLLVVLLIIHHSLEQRFIEDERLVYLPTDVSIELIHFTIGCLLGFGPAFDAMLS